MTIDWAKFEEGLLASMTPEEIVHRNQYWKLVEVSRKKGKVCSRVWEKGSRSPSPRN